MSELIRTLTPDEQTRKYVDCCWTWKGQQISCVRIPEFRLATPHGEMDFCREHIGYMIVELPSEWLDGFRYREPVLASSADDDIPF